MKQVFLTIFLTKSFIGSIRVFKGTIEISEIVKKKMLKKEDGLWEPHCFENIRILYLIGILRFFFL